MTIFLALILAAIGPDERPLNARVVEFARAKVGQKVGSGDCSALAAEALRYAGARRPSRGSWGEEVPALKDAQPGDILQFENARFVRRQVLPNGAILTLYYTLPHHIAIVSGVRKKGRNITLTILHQNVGSADDDEAERKLVQEWALNLADMKGGTVKAYRPVGESER